MTNALFNDNRLKLGVFGLNVSSGCAATTAEGHLQPTWQNNVDIAVMADRAGIEALVPVARWKGFGGQTNFNGTCFETYTWATGLAAATRQVAVFSTSHVPTIHPIVAAKQATTIDHISNGRFALHVVCGWYEPEFLMFGAPVMEHDTLYAYATACSKTLDACLRRHDNQEVIPAQAGIQEPYIQLQAALDPQQLLQVLPEDRLFLFLGQTLQT